MPKEKRPSKTKSKRSSKTDRPSKTVKPTEETASGHPSDRLERLRSALPLFYMILAWTYLDGGGNLTVSVRPTHLFMRAIQC
jgi:hypothetical protein